MWRVTTSKHDHVNRDDYDAITAATAQLDHLDNHDEHTNHTIARDPYGWEPVPVTVEFSRRDAVRRVFSFMGKVFRPWRIDETWLLPPPVSDFVTTGHPAHFVRDLVSEELDLSVIMGACTEVTGDPPDHPAMMVALLLYAYRSGVSSVTDGRSPPRGAGLIAEH